MKGQTPDGLNQIGAACSLLDGQGVCLTPLLLDLQYVFRHLLDEHSLPAGQVDDQRVFLLGLYRVEAGRNGDGDEEEKRQKQKPHSFPKAGEHDLLSSFRTRSAIGCFSHTPDQITLIIPENEEVRHTYLAGGRNFKVKAVDFVV
jgi:hypothetical protein